MTTVMNLTAATNSSTCNLVAGNMMTGSSSLGSNSKAITRLLQHSILQLCNEHIGYSHKLQILGVLCMTVDDEQQELVVKVNNTLKRVSPQGPNKDPQQLASQSAHVYGPSLGQDSVTSHQGLSEVDNAEQLSLQTAVLPSSASDAVSEASTPRSSHSPAETARRGHGRKRSRPVRVDHVYDEGDMIDEEGGDIMTVIPTDPDNPSENIQTQPIFLDDLSGNEDVDNEENVVHPPTSNSTPKKTAAYLRPKPNPPSTASPNVRALLQQSIARNRSTGKQSPKQASQLRNALLNGAQCLTLPICVAPTEKRQSAEDSLLLNGSINGDDNDTAVHDDHLGPLHIDEKSNNRDSDETTPLNDSGVSVKEEPKDEYDWSKAGQVTSLLQQESVASLINGPSFSSNPFSSYAIGGMDGVTSLPAYSAFNFALASNVNNSQPNDGLSIQYTSTGPITVGANGKNVSNQKVKDIIMYDDQSPLHQQKGARLETDFMVDKMGIEGRKRRRRAPDETLTLEEIAEYMGSSIITDPSIGNGTFKCKYCPVNVEDLISYLQHTLAVHNAYICHQCGKSFTTKSSLLRHRPIHTGMRRFACSICKKTFYRKDKCKAHIKRHFGEEGTVTQDVE